MQSHEYSEQLASFKLYLFQRRRERYCIIYVWKIMEGLVSNLSKPMFVLTQNAEEGYALFHMYIYADWGPLPIIIIVLDGEQHTFSMPCPNI